MSCPPFVGVLARKKGIRPIFVSPPDVSYRDERRNIIATFNLNHMGDIEQNLCIELWLKDDKVTYFIAIRRNKGRERTYFTIPLFEELVDFVEEMFRNNTEATIVFGKKKQVISVCKDIVNITTHYIIPQILKVNKNEWRNIMKIKPRILKVINKEEEHFLTLGATNIYITKESQSSYIIFEDSDVELGKKLAIQANVLLDLVNSYYYEQILEKLYYTRRRDHEQVDHLKLKSKAVLHMVYKDHYPKCDAKYSCCSHHCFPSPHVEFTLEKIYEYNSFSDYLNIDEYDIRPLIDSLAKLLRKMKYEVDSDERLQRRMQLIY